MDPAHVHGDASSGADGRVVSAERRLQYEQILNKFCRVSLANSEENVSEGMSLICDLLDETSK